MTRTITRALRSVVLGVLLGSMACAGGAPPAAMAPPPATAAVSLRPGDAIRVFIWQEPELSGEFLVAPNGMVVFPLLGVREVVGISPEEVETRLTADYAEFLENPSVNVTALRRVAILGEVRLPSLYWVDATVALTEALALAGGLTPTGNKNEIRLIRDGGVLIQSLDANNVLGATVIQSGDQIVVGQTGWASRNLGLIIGTSTSIFIALIYVLYR